jgi:hypothetical protein
VRTIENLSKKQFQTKEEYFDFLMMEIQQHLVEINDLKENNDPHAVSEMIDLSILTRLLALQEGADKKLFNERFRKFKEKASS